MGSCVAYNCTNTCSKKIPGLTFHSFPKDETRRQLWIKAVRRKNWTPTKYSKLCSEHFSEEFIDRTSLSCVRLRENAVPSIFDFPPHLQKVEKLRKLPTRAVIEPLQPDLEVNPPRSESQPAATDFLVRSTSSESPTEAKYKRKVDKLRAIIEAKNKKIKVLQQKIRRCKEAATRSSSQQDTPTIKTEPRTDDEPAFPYVIKGKRFVNVGYLIKSLQKLNSHGGTNCNFSDMYICGETKEGWNIGVELSCRICLTTAVVWMEDPDAKLIKTCPKLLKTAAIPQAQPQTTSILRIQPKIFPTKVSTKKPHPRRTPTPPPDNPVRHFLVPLPLARPPVNMPLVNPPQIAPFIKQEVIHGPPVGNAVPPSSSTKPAAVQLLFFVDQPASSQPVASTATASSVESITVTPDIFVGSEPYSSASLGTSTTTENITVTPDIYPADVLEVDLSLVKKEVEDESLGDGQQSTSDKPGVCLVPMSETSLDPSHKLFDDPKSSASSSASDIKISSVTSCTKTSGTSTTLGETADSNVPTLSCTPTFPIVRHEGEQGSKEYVFKRTAGGGESIRILSRNNSKRSKKDV